MPNPRKPGNPSRAHVNLSRQHQQLARSLGGGKLTRGVERSLDLVQHLPAIARCLQSQAAQGDPDAARLLEELGPVVALGDRHEEEKDAYY